MCTLRFGDPEGLPETHLPQGTGCHHQELVEPEPVEVGLRVPTVGTRLHPDGRDHGEAAKGRFIYADDRVIHYTLGPWRGTDPSQREARALAALEAREPLQEEPVRAPHDPGQGDPPPGGRGRPGPPERRRIRAGDTGRNAPGIDRPSQGPRVGLTTCPGPIWRKDPLTAQPACRYLLQPRTPSETRRSAHSPQRSGPGTPPLARSRRTYAAPR